MNKSLIDRVNLEYSLFLEGLSSREIGDRIGISKTMVLRDIHSKLKYMNPKKYREVVSILNTRKTKDPSREYRYKGNY